VDFDADLTGEWAAVNAMAEAVAHRGPDGAGVWLQPHVALGHRRLSIIDIDGGAQPMLARQDEDVVAAIAYNGEVYNFRELRRELQARGHIFRTLSDTECVLQAYLAWGLDFVDHLNGIYAFALWDTRREELLLVRDRLGVKPMYYVPTPSGVLFGSEPAAIAAHPAFEAAVDENGLRELLSPVRRPGATIWCGMYEVPPAGLVRINRSGCRVQHYWQLAAWSNHDSPNAAARTVRGLLESSVQGQLVADVPLCALLSGGLDSSALTAIAAQQLRHQAAGPLRSFSVDFAGDGEQFRSDVLRPDPDAPYAREVAGFTRTEHHVVVVDHGQLLDPVVRGAVLGAYDRLPVQNDLSLPLYLLFRAIREKSTVALSGEGADEMFGGYAWFHDAEDATAPTFPWLAATRRFPRFSILDPDVDRRLALDAYCDDLYAEALAEVPRLAGESDRDRRTREVTYLHLTRYLPLLLERADRLSMAVSLEVRVPFLDHRLVELAFNVPRQVRAYEREKGLLRTAVGDLLPDSVLTRRKSHFPVSRQPGYGQLIRQQFQELMATPAAPVFALADRRKLQWLAKDLGDAGDLSTRRLREHVLALNAWLITNRQRIAW